MKKLLFILMLLPALSYGQVPIHSYPLRDTVDSNSQFLGIEIIPGGWHTYRFPFSAFVTAIGGSVSAKPAGDPGEIQINGGGDTLYASNSFAWTPSGYRFGLGDGNAYIKADTSTKYVNIGVATGSDTLKGNVYVKNLAGNGTGYAGIDNNGKLSFTSANSKLDTSAVSLNNINVDVIALQINPMPTTTVYEIGGYVNVTAVSGGGFVQFAIVYFDETGANQVTSIFSAVTDVAGSGLSHMAAVGHFPIPSISVVIQAGSNFVIEGLHTGSVRYNLGCSVKQH